MGGVGKTGGCTAQPQELGKDREEDNISVGRSEAAVLLQPVCVDWSHKGPRKPA